MEPIIAGYLQLQDQAQSTIVELVGAGFSKEKISTFYVNPAGQHDLFPIGGDRDDSPGAKESAKGLAEGMIPGGLLGASIGILGIPFAGPLGPAVGTMVGAHLGGLAGSMASMKENGESERQDDENTLPQRLSGMLVAVCAPDLESEVQAIRILHAHRAEHIERAEGTIKDGEWLDFDPLSSPVLVETQGVLPS